MDSMGLTFSSFKGYSPHWKRAKLNCNPLSLRRISKTYLKWRVKVTTQITYNTLMKQRASDWILINNSCIYLQNSLKRLAKFPTCPYEIYLKKSTQEENCCIFLWYYLKKLKIPLVKAWHKLFMKERTAKFDTNKH